MMLHVEFLFIGEMVLDASLAKDGVNSIMLTKEKVTENLLALELLVLLCDDFLPELVDETKRNSRMKSSILDRCDDTHVLITLDHTLLV